MKKMLQSEIIKRFLGDKNFEEFLEQYNAACYISRTIKKPSEKDLRILALVKKEKSYSKVAKMVGISPYHVMNAVGRATAYKD